MLEELEDYDWKNVFAYAGGDAQSEYGIPVGAPAPISPVAGSGPVSQEGFGREDVAELFGLFEGENDGADWQIAGKLNDGRCFYITAGCDYTGWD